MFEQYTEKARQVIFFARYEASMLGAHAIDTSHMLLGLMREDKQLFSTLLPSVSLYKIGDSLRANASGEKVSTSIDLPLSKAGQRALVFAVEEAWIMQHPLIGTGHVLLGLLREPGAALEMLQELGLTLQSVRDFVKGREESRDASQLAIPDFGREKPPSGSQQALRDLRNRFGALVSHLKPEVEPAVVYALSADKYK